jgi:pilus assembly protein CpaE
MSKIRLLIVDDIPETRENIKRLLYFEKDMEVIGEAGNGEDAVKLAEKLKPDVILMDINMPIIDGITATEMIYLRVPTTNIIIMSVQGEQEYLKKAMIAGAREYLIKPFSSDELSETVRRVVQLEKRRQAHVITEQALTPELKEPQVISVFSTKGGVGKTTVATNLAVALAVETKRKVALIDLDLQFGDIAVMLNVVPRRTITDLIQEVGQLDGELLESYLVNHPSGIKVLPAPTRPEYAELITGSHIEKVINVLKQSYDYIVIDTSAVFNETNLTALDLSSQILVLLSLDLPTIKNVKLSLEVLESLHHKGKVKLVLNRSSNEFGIKHQDVERSINFLIAAHVPSDGKIVVSSVNKGNPFVVANPTAKISQSIKELANMVVYNEGSQDEIKAETSKKGIFGKLFG